MYLIATAEVPEMEEVTGEIKGIPGKPMLQDKEPTPKASIATKPLSIDQMVQEDPNLSFTRKKKNSKMYTRLPKGFIEHHYAKDTKCQNPHCTL